MHAQFPVGVAAAVVLGLAATTAQAQPAQPAGAPAADFAAALGGGEANLNFRYRLETVDQEPFARDATASTLLSRLNYRTLDWRGFAAFVEVDDVTVLGDDDAFNSTTNGAIDRPVVADPEYTEVNQAYLQYGSDAFTAIVGRQRIVLDNSRFIANVVWRQNEQTYDAVTLKSAALPRTQLLYSFIDNVNRVTGPRDGAQPADFHGASHVLNGKVGLGAFGAVTGFAYLLDFDNAPALSSSTYGIHWLGSRQVTEATRLDWAASYARQGDYGDNPTDYSADYYLLEGGVAFGRFGVKAGYEVLGGAAEPGRAFQTPLATLHAFNGWADKFLTTPPGGIEDFYVGASAGLGPVALQVIWHDFGAEATNQDYGSEWNAVATMKFGARKNYDLMLKFADYRADGFATDTTKLWIQFSAAF